MANKNLYTGDKYLPSIFSAISVSLHQARTVITGKKGLPCPLRPICSKKRVGGLPVLHMSLLYPSKYAGELLSEDVRKIFG